MNRMSRGVLIVLLVLSAVAPAARGERRQEPVPPPVAPAPATTPPPAASPAAPATPAPATPAPHDNLDEFVPKEKVKADSVVAFPVDI